MDHIQDHINGLRQYFRDGTLQHDPKGSQIIAVNDTKNAIYYIGAGYVRVYSINPRGEQYTHIIYGPGEVFPMTWLTIQQSVNIYFETMVDSEIYCVPLTEFKKDLLSENHLAYGMMQQAIDQYRLYAMRVDNLEYKYASERVAYRLILLANRFGEHSGSSITILPPLTHQLIGSSINLSRESVSREMEKLVRRNLIHYNAGRQIVINDIKALATSSHVPLHQGLSASSTPLE